MRFLILSVFVLSIHWSFAQKEGYRLKLPYNSGFMSSYAEITPDASKMYRLVNVPRRMEAFIECYDLKTGNLLSKNRISGSPNYGSFYRINDEDYYIFDVNDRKIIKYQNGEITKQFSELDTNSNSGFGSYFVEMNFNPISLYNDKLILVNNLLLNPERPLKGTAQKIFIRTFDLTSHKLTYVSKAPKELEKNDYGMLNRFSCIRQDQKLIIAPYYSNEICIYDLKSNTVSFPNVDKYNPAYSATRPLLRNKAEIKKKITNKEYYSEMITHYLNTGQYIGILYDKYKQQFYRIRLDFVNGNKRKYKMSIIVLNQKFKFKGTIDVPDGYVFDSMFVTEKGIQIANHKKYLLDNDHLVFDSFNL